MDLTCVASPASSCMEPPECPVCLQPFDGESIIPRVLSCGHSACESCLIQLPKPPFPNTIRCPACTQLLIYPSNPQALPKNIDLLRISSSLLRQSNLNPKPKPKTPTPSDFIPNLWSHEFYFNWKDWILPQDTISVDNTDGSFFHATVINSSRCSIKINQKLCLFKVASFMHNNNNNNNNNRFNYSYISKVMLILFKMRDEALPELELLLKSSLDQYRVCSAYGLWYNMEDGHLYLVCDRKSTTLFNVISSDLEYDISSFAIIGMELCETVSRLHDTQLVTGCTSLSCYGIDDFGHILINLNDVLMVGQRLQKMITEAVSFAKTNDSKPNFIPAFPSPEVLVEFLQKQDVDLKFDKSTFAIGYSSDVWSLACILLCFLVGKSFIEETRDFLSNYILTLINRNDCDSDGLYVAWLGKVYGFLDSRLGSDCALMKELLYKCLGLDPGTRPNVNDLWKCMRELIIKPKFDVIGNTQHKTTIGSTCHCLLLGDLLWSPKKTNKVGNKNGLMNDKNLVVESDVIEGVLKNSLICTDLKGHLDCISGLAIGGGFLFSSSYDKTINVWSLQGFNHVHTFKGHEHKVMAVVFVDSDTPLCISADNGGDIFIWGATLPFEEKPFIKLNEEKDWRYSGVHALAVSGFGYFYTGSGDMSIKAWSMNDYSLSSTMTGHKSVVSALAVSNGVLYSGSWDGTIRLWCLSDHSSLAVLGEVASTCGSVLSLATHSHTLVAAHENGSIKIWNKDVPMNPISTHSSSIFSVYMEGQWLFSGGWNKTIVIQKLSDDESRVDVTEIGSISGDSVVTALLYWQGRLFVGHADRIIKVYSFG